MRLVLRRLRGMLRMGVVWAFVWTPLGALLGAGWLYRAPRSSVVFTLAVDSVTAVILVGAAFGIGGFITGSLFAALLGIAERCQSVDTIRMRRAVAWGGLAGAILPLLTGAPVLIGIIGPMALGAGLGATCAAATLKMARTAPAQVGAVQDGKHTSRLIRLDA